MLVPSLPWQNDHVSYKTGSKQGVVRTGWQQSSQPYQPAIAGWSCTSDMLPSVHRSQSSAVVQGAWVTGTPPSAFAQAWMGRSAIRWIPVYVHIIVHNVHTRATITIILEPKTASCFDRSACLPLACLEKHQWCCILCTDQKDQWRCCFVCRAGLSYQRRTRRPPRR
jgi:hypothetical protein